MVPDIDRKDSVVVDYMNLDTDGNLSYFYNATRFEMDSAYTKTGKMNMLGGYKRYDHNLNYEIKKNHSERKVDFYTKFSGLNLKIEEDTPLNWKLSDEYKKLGDFNCQKAETSYKGRQWIAWFTTEIPLRDGPYKFYELPGMIVELYDKNKHHQFELIEIKNISSMYLGISNEKRVKTMKMNEYLGNFRNRPFSPKDNISFINVSNLSNTMTIVTKDSNYINLDKKSLEKYKGEKGRVDKEIEKMLRITNNPIEIHY